jgi:hypothetical protein
MMETRLPDAEPPLEADRLPPNPAYREMARTADRELLEWMRRRAERRACLRQEVREAEAGRTGDG